MAHASQGGGAVTAMGDDAQGNAGADGSAHRSALDDPDPGALRRADVEHRGALRGVGCQQARLDRVARGDGGLRVAEVRQVDGEQLLGQGPAAQGSR